jgi:lipopolysaccharide biosynthesis glycosyltransferase
MKPLKVFIGYDKAEPVAYHVCAESIISNSSVPVSITPLYMPQLQNFKTPKHQQGYKPSNGFIFSRFLTPYLSNYRDKALFVDGDMVVKGDVAELFEMDMSGLGVRVVKHDYRTTANKKYLGSVNLDYPRKNWSSVILWNNWFAPNSVLTPEYVGNQTGEHLHRFGWLTDEQIGDLPKGWNVLADEPNQAPYNEAKLIHYTLGTCCFDDYRHCQYADDWHRYHEDMNFCRQA